MVDYDVTISKSAVKEFVALDDPLLNRVYKKIEALSHNPRPIGCIKLHGSNNLWRIRVSNYRILYSISDKKFIVDIIAVKHRKEAYK